jgi:hypothetical protein
MGNIRSVQASPKYIHIHNQQGLIIWRTTRISVRIMIIHLCTSLRTSSNLVPTPDATPWRCRSKIIFILKVHWISCAFWPVSRKQSLRTVWHTYRNSQRLISICPWIMDSLTVFFTTCYIQWKFPVQWCNDHHLWVVNWLRKRNTYEHLVKENAILQRKLVKILLRVLLGT